MNDTYLYQHALRGPGRRPFGRRVRWWFRFAFPTFLFRLALCSAAMVGIGLFYGLFDRI